MTDIATHREGDLRRSILDTARRLLVQDGYDRLSMRRIARHIGYSATAIYLHFENKDALVHALIDEGMESLYRRLVDAAEAAGEGRIRRLEAVCRAYVAFGMENPEYYEIMHLLQADRMARYPAEKYRRARRNLELIATVLSDTGTFAVRDPMVAASSVWATLHGGVSLLISRRMDVRISRESLVDTLMGQVLRGVVNPAHIAS